MVWMKFIVGIEVSSEHIESRLETRNDLMSLCYIDLIIKLIKTIQTRKSYDKSLILLILIRTMYKHLARIIYHS